jgi:hypothetical protein
MFRRAVFEHGAVSNRQRTIGRSQSANAQPTVEDLGIMIDAPDVGVRRK